jgi:hypothetical protein
VDLVLPTGWEDIGAKGLVVLFVLMIFLGWLIPKRWVDRQLSDKDKQIAMLTEANDRLTRALQDLTVTAHTGPIALRSIAREADKAGGD